MSLKLRFNLFQLVATSLTRMFNTILCLIIMAQSPFNYQICIATLRNHFITWSDQLISGWVGCDNTHFLLYQLHSPNLCQNKFFYWHIVNNPNYKNPPIMQIFDGGLVIWKKYITISHINMSHSFSLNPYFYGQSFSRMNLYCKYLRPY